MPGIASGPRTGDVVDLITGVPLVQEIDFELPFGGAVFRHVRTYSENAAYHNMLTDAPATYEIEVHAEAARTFYDWNGLFWMMSEQPVFLMDAQFDYWHSDPNSQAISRRCYFIPDAHHAIPFIAECQGGPNDPAECGRYVAPPWFDAFLDHDGVMNEDAEWVTPPRRVLRVAGQRFDQVHHRDQLLGHARAGQRGQRPPSAGT